MRRLLGILIAAAVVGGLTTAAIAATGGVSKNAPKKKVAAKAAPASLVHPGEFEINGDVAQPRTLKVSELAILPQQTITVSIDGVTHTETGPYLESVLNLAVPNYLACNKNNLLRWWIQVTSRDAGSTVLGVGEVDPGFGNRPAILSISEDGKFLTMQGPRLIVPGDGASTRDIAHVEMVSTGMAAPQLPIGGCTASGTPTYITPTIGSLIVNGDVANPTTYSFAQLQAMPQTTQTVSFLSGSTPTTNTEGTAALEHPRRGPAEVQEHLPQRQAPLLRRDHRQRRLHEHPVLRRDRLEPRQPQPARFAERERDVTGERRPARAPERGRQGRARGVRARSRSPCSESPRSPPPPVARQKPRRTKGLRPMSTLTTRNQLEGKVTSVINGNVMAEVKVDVHGEEFVAAVTPHSVQRLDLSEGDTVTVLVKATEVMLAKSSSQLEGLSTRNQIKGKVASVTSGSVMAEVAIDASGSKLVAAVTKNSVERLGLAKGDDVIVLIKATEVMLAK